MIVPVQRVVHDRLARAAAERFGLAEVPDFSIEVPPTRALGVEKVEPALLDAVARLVALLATPHDVPALAPLVDQSGRQELARTRLADDQHRHGGR